MRKLKIRDFDFHTKSPFVHYDIDKNAETPIDTKKKEISTMPRPCSENGEKNLISQSLRELRNAAGWSQRDLANKLQLEGCDIDRNVITRIENNKRYVTDIELRAFCRIFKVSYSCLIEGGD